MTRRSERYDEAFLATREIVNRHVPVGLLSMGAPEDEYDAEVRDFVRMVLRDGDLDERSVSAVWVRWFGADYSMSGTALLRGLTADLQQLLRQFDEGTTATT
jgi:hypothetical protein